VSTYNTKSSSSSYRYYLNILSRDDSGDHIPYYVIVQLRKRTTVSSIAKFPILKDYSSTVNKEDKVMSIVVKYGLRSI